jgi:hypothetical protein
MSEDSKSKGVMATLTPREQEVLLAGLQNLKNGVEIQVSPGQADVLVSINTVLRSTTTA